MCIYDIKVELKLFREIKSNNKREWGIKKLVVVVYVRGICLFI